MKQERDDKLGRALAAAIQRRNPGEECPDMNRFAAAIDNKLPEKEREEFRAHLAACPRCLETFTAAHELVHDQEPAGIQFGKGLRWAGSLAAIATVAVLAIRLSQPPDAIKTQVASSPPIEAIPGTPQPTKPETSTAAIPSPQPKQVLLAFADADDFWSSSGGQGDRPRYRIRGIGGEPPVMSSSSTAAQPLAADKEKGAALNAFRIGVSLRQVQFANDAADRTALADRLRVLAKNLENAGERDTVEDTKTLQEQISTMTDAQLKASIGKLLAAKPADSSYARLGKWAEAVREKLANNELRNIKRLSAEADTLLKLDFTPAIKADVEKVRTALNPKDGSMAVECDAVRKLLTAMVADLKK